MNKSEKEIEELAEKYWHNKRGIIESALSFDNPDIKKAFIAGFKAAQQIGGEEMTVDDFFLKTSEARVLTGWAEGMAQHEEALNTVKRTSQYLRKRYLAKLETIKKKAQ